MFPVYRVYDKSPFFEVFILHFLILSEMVPTPLAFRVINFKILHKLPSLQNVFSTKLLWSAPLHPACVQECCWEHWNLSPIHPISSFNLLPILTGRSHRELSLSYKGPFTDTTSACQASWEMVMQPFLNIIIKMRHIAWNKDFKKSFREGVGHTRSLCIARYQSSRFMVSKMKNGPAVIIDVIPTQTVYFVLPCAFSTFLCRLFLLKNVSCIAWKSTLLHSISTFITPQNILKFPCQNSIFPEKLFFFVTVFCQEFLHVM